MGGGKVWGGVFGMDHIVSSKYLVFSGQLQEAKRELEDGGLREIVKTVQTTFECPEKTGLAIVGKEEEVKNTLQTRK